MDVVAVGAAVLAAAAAVSAVDLGVDPRDCRLWAQAVPDHLGDAKVLGLLAVVRPVGGALFPRPNHKVVAVVAAPMVLLHDFAVIPPGLHRRRFEEYSLALQFYELKWMNDTLATFTPKRSTSANAVE